MALRRVRAQATKRPPVAMACSRDMPRDPPRPALLAQEGSVGLGPDLAPQGRARGILTTIGPSIVKADAARRGSLAAI